MAINERVSFNSALSAEHNVSLAKLVDVQFLNHRVIDEFKVVGANVAKTDVADIDNRCPIVNVVTRLQLSAKRPGL